MREIINIHVGQAGVRIGNACWELFCREHNIQPDGTVLENDMKEFSENIMHSSFFSEDSKGKYTPRSIFVDLDPSSVDEIRTGSHKNLYDSSFLISGKEDASNVFYRGAFTTGVRIRRDASEQIRKLAENCDSLGGFIMTHSLSGGTGSGVGGLLMTDLQVKYSSKISKQSFSLLPSPDISDIIVGPYNATMGLYSLANGIDSIIMLDNQALYRICSEHLNIEAPDYMNVNRVIAQLISSSTVSMRFSDESITSSLQELHANMIPFPSLKYLTPSLAPLIEINKAYHKQPDLEKITESALKPDSSLFSCETSKEKYLACSMMYRGDVVLKEVSSILKEDRIKRSMKFVDWVPTGFIAGNCPKAMIANEDMRGVSKGLCMISNNTAFVKGFELLLKKYNKLADKRAFAYWYCSQENMEDSDFRFCREDLENVIDSYKEVSSL